MRDILLDILNHTHDLTAFEFLRIYHTKEVVTEIIPDRFGKVTKVLDYSNQFQTTRKDVPWLEVGMPVRFTVNRDDSSRDSSLSLEDSSTLFLQETTLDQTQTYFITNIQGNDACLKFTIGETPAPEDVLELPIIDQDFFVVNDRSYFVVSDTSKFKVDDPVLFELLPDSSTALLNADLSANTRYYVNEIIDGNKLRVSKIKGGEFIHYPFLQNFSFEMVIDKTFIEAVSEDRVIYVVAETKTKITDFNGEFGMDELDKLYSILDNPDEYFINPNDSAASLPFDDVLLDPVDYNIPIVTNSNIGNEFVSTKLNFKNADNTFRDEYILTDKSKLSDLHPMIDFKGSLWNFSFTPSNLSIARFDDMAKTYNEFLYFDVSTSEIDYTNPDYPALPHYQLDFKFGEDNPYFGEIVFHPQLNGTYIPQIIYKYKAFVNKVIADYRGFITKMTHKEIYTVLQVSDSANLLYINNTSVLTKNLEINFKNPDDSSTALLNVGIDKLKKYYIKEIIDCNQFSVSETIGGDAVDFPATDFEFFLEKEVNTFEMTFDPPENSDPTAANDSTNAALDDTKPPIDTTYQNQQNWLLEGLPVKFMPIDDSAAALAQYGIDYDKTYYVKTIYNTLKDPDSSRTPKISRFSVSETIGGPAITLQDGDVQNLDSTIPMMDSFICYHEVNEIEIDDTRWFEPGDPIKFKGLADDSSTVPFEIDIDPFKLYYIKEITSPTRFTFSETPNGDEFVLPKLAIIDFNFIVIRENNNGVLFTSHPSLDIDPTNSNVLTTIYGNDYPIIPNNETTEFVYGNRKSLLPAEPSIFGPLKLGDIIDDSTDKIYDDSTLAINRDAQGNTAFDGKFVYAFDYDTTMLEENFSTDSYDVGDEVKIYDSVQKGYLMPVGFLRQTWTYYVPHTLAILSLSDTKSMRFSDQGKMMITLDNNIATYNYIIPSKQ